MVFDAGAAAQNAVNDLGGTTFSALRVEAPGYELSGDDIEAHFFTVSAPTTLPTGLEVPSGAGEHLHHVTADFTIDAPHQLRFTQAANATDIVRLEGGATLTARIGGDDQALRFRGAGAVELRGTTYAGTIGLEDDITLSCGGGDCGGAGGAVTVVDEASLEYTGDTEFQRPITLGDGVLTLEGDATVPQFAGLTSDPTGEVRVGTASGPGRLSIEEGQFGHEGSTAVDGDEHCSSQTTLTWDVTVLDGFAPAEGDEVTSGEYTFDARVGRNRRAAARHVGARAVPVPVAVPVGRAHQVADGRPWRRLG